MRNDLLLALRTQRGWTQEQLSERSGVSVRTIRNLEQGRIHSPRRSSLDLLFSVLDPELRSLVQINGSGLPGSAADPGRLPFPTAPGSPFAGTDGEGWSSPPVPQGRWRGPLPPRTSLVGRDDDLDRLSGLITSHAVTVLTGPGGVGKTRLALAVAERTADRFPGGVAVVQLGRITAAASAAGGDGPAALSAAEQAVAELLGDERQAPGAAPTLLVLDTAEHLPQITAVLVDRLRGARPDLRLIITTRRPPVIPEARIWEMEPLPPDAAVQLMRCRLAGNSATDDLTRSFDLVQKLCWELDHLPRLIEFAAYWLRNVPVSALLSLEHVLELLGLPDYSVLPHQRSLHGSLEWSWAMLGERHRRFMVRLAEQPQPIASDAPELGELEPGVSGTEAVYLLAELANASLLQVSRGAVYEYRMLRHVRAFVRNRSPDPAESRVPAGLQPSCV
ncbi:helix-turn-helix domain-containing protein [Streptacidiphilus sp. N1-3]|uniref:Helix-turn-helix domain-containing protein n=1 Tax=Streptacidiphilus alkalitolerans TaxID=3342712 RepID=A0ABV6X108_9ACTN